MWFVKLLIRIQPLIVVGLFIAFLIVFGWPSYNKFVLEHIFIKETKLLSQPIDAPGVTICVDPVSFILNYLFSKLNLFINLAMGTSLDSFSIVQHPQ